MDYTKIPLRSDKTEISNTDETSKRTPLTSAQREICIGQQLEPNSPLYNMGMLYDIEGELDTKKFIQSWNTVVERSDALRMRLHLIDGEAVQVVTNKKVKTTEVDFSQESNPGNTAKAWIQNALEKPMPLQDALVESTLVKVASDKWLWFCKQHHIITDASSFAAIWQQIRSLYSGDPDKKSAKPTNNYLDYVSTLLKDQTGICEDDTQSRTEDLKQYWQSKELPPTLALYGRKPTFTSTDASRDCDFFESSKSQQLESILQQSDIRSFSPHMARFQVLLTVLFAYLYRVSGQTSLAVATTAPNRSNPAYANTPGLFVELLPLNLDIEPNESFASLHSKVKVQVMNFLKNTAPGASSWISNRNVSAVLNYVPLTMEALDGMPVTTEWLHADHMDRQHAVRLHAMDWNNAGEVSLAFDTNDSCFTPEQKNITQLHWLRLFDAFCADRGQTIDAVNIVGKEELVSGDESSGVKPQQATGNTTLVDPIIARFLQAVQLYANETAVVVGAEEISYSDLAERIELLTQELASAKVGPNKNVAILLPRSLSVPIALMSTLKAGATYIPIEPNNPPDRIRHLLDNAMAELVITNAELATKLDDKHSTLILNAAGISQSSSSKINTSADTASNQKSKNSSDVPAYILYTSGSTGTPKGVVISRPALMNYCNWAIDFYTKGKQLAFPFFTPLGFDLTVTSLFVPLLSGGAVHIYPTTSDDIDNSLFNVIRDDKVDIIKLTPAHLAMLQQQDLSQSRVAQLIVGGEDLKSHVAQNIHQAFDKKIQIHNEYGPTEATVGCIVHCFDPVTDVAGSVPIGRPVADMQALVLNDALQPQPAGVAGMLYLSGPSLANGYWQEPEQTDSEFLSVNNDARVHYRTGDFVRLSESGQLVYLGRQDDQRKIRGARVELAEIESAVLQNLPVSTCVVASIQSSANNHQAEETFCTRCGLSSLYPEATISQNGLCSLCTGFESYKHKAQLYFKSTQDLESIIENLKSRSKSKYDCMVLLSGGKDSTYTLAQLSDMGLSVLAYTLDNGYLSTEAKSNIKHVCLALNIDHEFAKTPEMRKIFAESLEQFSNVCNGCFKTIYTLSMQRAQELNIPAIFTGLSRGQFFETRLTEELFSNPEINSDTIDATVLSARKAYHRTNDAVSKLLDTRHFHNDDIFEEVQIYDFYRYCDVNLDEMLSYLQERLPWVRPKDTGRSTNCLINDAGIYVHKLERGFHNYSLPYSWDVRLGHKERDEALEELNDDINVANVKDILSEVGYTARDSNKAEERLALYFTADSKLDPAEVKQSLKSTLPSWMIPDWFIQLETLPLSDNGKVAKSALPDPVAQRTIASVDYVEPSTDIEKKLVKIWCEQLKTDRIGIHDNFFELGGDSLSAIRIATKINESGMKFSNAELFEYQTVAEIAKRHQDQTSVHQPSNAIETTKQAPEAFGSLNSNQMDKLAKVLGKSKKPRV